MSRQRYALSSSDGGMPSYAGMRVCDEKVIPGHRAGRAGRHKSVGGSHRGAIIWARITCLRDYVRGEYDPVKVVSDSSRLELKGGVCEIRQLQGSDMSDHGTRKYGACQSPNRSAGLVGFYLGCRCVRVLDRERARCLPWLPFRREEM